MVSAPTVTILKGHVLDKLKELPNQSVHMCMTSPPYWGLRDYSRCECAINYGGAMGPLISGGQMSPDPRNNKSPDPNCPKCHGTGKDESLTVIWDAKEGCVHEWGEQIPREDKGGVVSPGRRQHLEELGKKLGTGGGIKQSNPILYERHSGDSGAFCHLCGAWRGQLGLEPTPDLYVQHIVQIFREVKRVLRDDGVMFLNMGDCYASQAGGNRGVPEEWSRSGRGESAPVVHKFPGLKPKDLV